MLNGFGSKITFLACGNLEQEKRQDATFAEQKSENHHCAVTKQVKVIFEVSCFGVGEVNTVFKNAFQNI